MTVSRPNGSDAAKAVQSTRDKKRVEILQLVDFQALAFFYPQQLAMSLVG
jgi:hypothetical protein